MSGPTLPAEPGERLIVPLDFPSGREALAMARRLEPVRWVKVGLELFCAEGPGIVEDLASMGKQVFLDLKLHDIPNTVAGAVASVTRLPVRLLTMHASAGPKAMEAASRAAAERDDFGVLAVTRLTSDATGGSDFADVARFAEGAAQAGLFGVVCPAAAAPLVRERFGDRLARVVPGIRPRGVEAHDQVHVATPEKAIAAGAHWIVVGRAITRADDPAAAARGILAALAGGA
ncbi:MAG: orotidine-5'-phosphate decarboxylase [Candidatus Eisenbacteria bacterium]|nr:orotidine-5'-phosphate decarboxylase [Candidatus Eisenbacteria bacterium]